MKQHRKESLVFYQINFKWIYAAIEELLSGFIIKTIQAAVSNVLVLKFKYK